MTTATMVQTLKDCDQDFEWYPTTPQMLSVIRGDLEKLYNPYDRHDYKLCVSVLDVGAGNGSALEALTHGTKYAIEKAKPLLDALSPKILVVGTDFHQQTLLDKKVNVVFSNPPYSDYVSWVVKILKEANCSLVYLVIPQRWRDNEEIKYYLDARKATSEILYSGDFAEASRQARAKIDIVRVNLGKVHPHRTSYDYAYCDVDPFELWFKEHFAFEVKQHEQSEYSRQREAEAKAKQKVKESFELIQDQGLVKTLETLYTNQMQKLMSTYLKLTEVDSDLLEELNVNVSGVQAALKLKIDSLKCFYWNELFNNLTVITNKLSSGSRAKLMETLLKHTQVDFTCENAHAVVVWVIKNANQYFDQQVIDLVEGMTERANIALYKSNQKTFGDEQWRYQFRMPDGLDRYQLDYRVVITKTGGIGSMSSGLSDQCENFINDIITIATNLGFDATMTAGAHQRQWVSNKKQVMDYFHHQKQVTQPLFEAKAFMNGNVHIKFNQSFIMRLNVEFGRLKGWIKSPKEAHDEMDIPLEEAQKGFQSNLQLTKSNVPLLMAA